MAKDSRGVSGQMGIPNRFVFFDIETRYLGEDSPFSSEAKKQHEVVMIQHRAGSAASSRAEANVVSSKFLQSDFLAAREEKGVLSSFSKALDPKDTLVGWNNLSFDQPTISHRMKKHEVASDFGKVRQIDMMTELQKAHRKLGHVRPFDLRTYTRDLIETVTHGFDEKQTTDYLAKWGVEPEGKGKIHLKGKVLGGHEYWKALSDPEATKDFIKYGKSDVNVLAFIEAHTKVVSAATSSEEPSWDVLKRMKRYPQGESAEKFFRHEVDQRREQIQQWEQLHGRPAWKVQLTGPESIGQSHFAEFMRRQTPGLDTGDVAWMVYDEDFAEELGYDRPVVGAQITYKGQSHRFDFRSRGQREHFAHLGRRIAEENQYTDILEEMDLRAEKGLQEWKTKAAKARYEGEIARAGASKALGTTESITTPGLDDYVSESVRNVGKFEKLSLLSKAAPYAAAVVAGADVLSSRDKTGPFWGLAAGGVAFALTRRMATLPRVGVVGAGYALTRMIAGSLSKAHSGSLPGFEEQGEAPVMRKQLTDFGSGWDPIRKILKGAAGMAASLGKDVPSYKKQLVASIRQQLLDVATSSSGQGIGSGGIGAVSLYETSIQGQTFKFAKKSYDVNSLGVEGARKVLRQERKALAAGRDAGMPSVYGVGEDESGPFMLMELMEGQTLDEFVRQGGKVTSTMMQDIQSSAQSLHKAGMYHSDIKPANVIIGTSGEGKGRAMLIDPTAQRYEDMGLFLTTREQQAIGKAQDDMALGMLKKVALNVDATENALNLLANAPTVDAVGRLFGKEQALGVLSASGSNVTSLRRVEQTVGQVYKKAGLSSNPYSSDTILSLQDLQQEASQGFLSQDQYEGLIQQKEHLMGQLEWADKNITRLNKSGQRIQRKVRTDVIDYNAAKESSVDTLWNAKHPEIEGFQDIGVAGGQRKTLTDFGSGSDPVRRIAREVFGIMKKGRGLYDELMQHREWRTALDEAEVIETIGSGGAGTAEKLVGNVRGRKFNLVRKTFSDETKSVMDNEYEVLMAGARNRMPSVYDVHGNSMLMEYIPGKTAKDYVELGGKITNKHIRQVKKQMKSLHKKGYASGDLSDKNIMISEKGDAFVIDPPPGIRNRGIAADLGMDSPNGLFALQKYQDEMQLKQWENFAKSSRQKKKLKMHHHRLMNISNVDVATGAQALVESKTSPHHLNQYRKVAKKFGAHFGMSRQEQLRRYPEDLGTNRINQKKREYISGDAETIAMQHNTHGQNVAQNPAQTSVAVDPYRPTELNLGPRQGSISTSQNQPVLAQKTAGQGTQKTAGQGVQKTAGQGGQTTAGQGPKRAAARGIAAANRRRQQLHNSAIDGAIDTMNPQRGSRSSVPAPGGDIATAGQNPYKRNR